MYVHTVGLLYMHICRYVYIYVCMVVYLVNIKSCAFQPKSKSLCSPVSWLVEHHEFNCSVGLLGVLTVCIQEAVARDKMQPSAWIMHVHFFGSSSFAVNSPVVLLQMKHYTDGPAPQKCQFSICAVYSKTVV